MTDAQFNKLVAVLTAQTAALEAIYQNLNALVMAKGGKPIGENWDRTKKMLQNGMSVSQQI